MLSKIDALRGHSGTRSARARRQADPAQPGKALEAHGGWRFAIDVIPLDKDVADPDTHAHRVDGAPEFEKNPPSLVVLTTQPR
jgi:hypothetical protein